MRARDYFEWLRADVIELVEMEDRVTSMRVAASSPKAQGQGPTSGGVATQPIADRLIDEERALDSRRAHLAGELDRATDVLYGRSGRGGVAKACGTAAADSVCGYYLYGMSWPDVADELVRPDSKDGAHWCRNRANAALRHIDAVGMARLSDS